MSIRVIAFACLLLSVPAYAKDDCQAAKGATVAGKVSSVSDGDTMTVGADKVRLFGLDAPPNSSPSGKLSAKALTTLVTGKEVKCQVVDKSKSGRCVAVCTSAGKDVSEQMIESGSAFMLRGLAYFSNWQARYDAAELNARSNKRGFWAN